MSVSKTTGLRVYSDEALDDLIDLWHFTEDPRPLHIFLNMTKDEYAVFVTQSYTAYYWFATGLNTGVGDD